MRILLANTGRIPVSRYGGTERVVWSLGKELVRLGHQVTFLTGPGSSCGFARVFILDVKRDISEQVPANTDIIHFHYPPGNLENLHVPHLVTVHGNWNKRNLDINSVFVSENHASRHGSGTYVHNGLDWDEYDPPDMNMPRNYFHFLAKAAWRVKNVRGAIEVIKRTGGEQLKVLGGRRLNFKMGFRFTLSRRVKFCGMVGGYRKYKLINGSRGLLFPVTWHEPFGLSVIESLFYGCPVFATPYGSLKELVIPEVGYLSSKADDLAAALESHEGFSRKRCHEYATGKFSARSMVRSYLPLYEKAMNGEPLNEQLPSLKTTREDHLEWIS